MTMNTRSFRATELQDNNLKWLQQQGNDFVPAIWGVTLIPSPVYASYAKDEEGFEQPVGEPLYYEWSALLDPADTPLPSWITEVVEEPTPISEPSSDSPGLLTKLKSAIGF
jgi:hypothetical protein